MKIYYNQNGFIVKGENYPIFINGEFGINYRYIFIKDNKELAEFNLSKTYKEEFNVTELVDYVTTSNLDSRKATNEYFEKAGKNNTLKYEKDAQILLEDFIKNFDIINKLKNKGN